MILFAENVESIKKHEKELPTIPTPRDNTGTFLFSIFALVLI